MKATADTPYDMIVIMDADNTTDPDFLSEINRAFQAGEKAIQAHRTAKNMNTDVAVLDATGLGVHGGHEALLRERLAQRRDVVVDRVGATQRMRSPQQ